MARIAPIDRAHPAAAVAPQLDAVRKKLGVVPNLIATLAHAPAALNAYLGLSEAVAGGAFDAKTRERIALAVAEANDCGYCLAAHSLIGKGAGLSDTEIDAARRGQADEPRAAALVRLARAIVATQGRVGDAELAAARAAGLTDGDVLETVANVVANILTNYTNHLAETDVDFPAARKLAA